MNFKLILTLFNLPIYKIRTTQLNFELGCNYEIEKKNSTQPIKEKVRKNQDCALIPLKDIPKNKPIWDHRVY